MKLRTRKRIIDALYERQWMNKWSYIMRVMDSCKTQTQLNNAYCWGCALLNKELRFVAQKNHLSYNDLSSFTKVYRDKIFDLWNDKFPHLEITELCKTL